ncbi:RNA-directed DNA polymerase from mobile element jockey [Trichonephila clavipes]|nr:RNA-directed DNA polymerase from mobile element jockey [Trichonephila clavipes]
MAGFSGSSFLPSDIGHVNSGERVSPMEGVPHWHPTPFANGHLNFPNPEVGGASSFRVLPELYFSGSENVEEFLEGVENNVKFWEMPSNLACAYLKGHLLGRAKDWYEIFESKLVQDTVTDFAQLKKALTKKFPVVQNRKDLELKFYSVRQKLVLPRPNIDEIAAVGGVSRFLVLPLTNKDVSSKSPFAIQKALVGIGGEPKSVKRLRSGDLPIETLSAIQTMSFLQAKTFLNSPVTICPHKTLNSCRGVLSEPDLLTTTDAEIQWRNGELLGLLQKARKLIVPQLSQTYAQAAKSSTLNNSTQTDENIIKMKCPPLKLLAPLSSKQRPNISTTVTTSSSAQTQLLSSISSKTSTISDPKAPTPMPEIKEKIKEQPSQAHGPQKNHKKTDLKNDFPNESTPVSKRSRRRKPFKTSDAMDKDADLSDTDYVIGRASEEDESLLEADFKQCEDEPSWRQIEQELSDHCLCLLNHEEPTYFDEPPWSFHTLDLAIFSPSLLHTLNLSIEKDLYNSDHFPVILSHNYDTGGKTIPPTYSYSHADWALFTQLAVISDAMVKTESVDTAVQEVTNVLIAAADLSILKSSSHSFQRYKPWWNTDCQTA